MNAKAQAAAQRRIGIRNEIRIDINDTTNEGGTKSCPHHFLLIAVR
jgi:hypothetical protein